MENVITSIDYRSFYVSGTILFLYLFIHLLFIYYLSFINYIFQIKWQKVGHKLELRFSMTKKI